MRYALFYLIFGRFETNRGPQRPENNQHHNKHKIQEIIFPDCQHAAAELSYVRGRTPEVALGRPGTWIAERAWSRRPLPAACS